MLVAPNALGIEAASFWSEAEKDIAESPTRSGTPKRKTPSHQVTETQRPQDYKIIRQMRVEN